MMKRKLFILALIMTLIIPMTMPASYASVDAAAVQNTGSAFADMPKDWSTTAIENAVDNGLLSGYLGKVMPKENITRAQMAAVVNRAFGTVKEASLDHFSDVPEGAWYCDDMAKAVQMQTYFGNGKGKLEPNSSITREEAFTVLARAFKLSDADKSVLEKFTDRYSISSWAEESVASLVNAGYVGGSNGKLNPKQYITRAEFAQLMDNILKHYIVEAGTYSENMTGNVMIKVPEVTLKDVTISGDLVIGDGVGDGNVTLDNVKITGRTVIRGGGPNSIRIIGNSNIGNVIVSRIDGIVHVKVEGDAQVNIINIADGSDDVILDGKFGDIQLNADDVTVKAVDAEIATVKIAGNDSEVIVDTGSNIGSIGISGQNTKISGSGTVPKIEVLAGGDHASIMTPNSKITVSGGVSGVTGGGGETLNAGTSGTNNTQGSALKKDQPKRGSGNSDSTPTVFSITASAGGDSYINGAEASGAAISVVPSGGTIQSVTVSGLNIQNGSALTVSAIQNNQTGKFEFDATRFKDGTLMVTATSTDNQNDEATLTLDTQTAKLITGGKLVELKDAANPLSVVHVSRWAFPSSGDLNGDGLLDVVVGDMAGRVYTFYQESSGTYQAANPDPLGAISTGMYTFPGLGDLDGDGDLDLVVSLQTGYVQYYENTGTAVSPAFTLQSGAGNPFAAVYHPSYAFNAVGDVDDDGDADVLFGYGDNYYTQSLELWYNNGSGSFTTSTAIAPFSGYTTGQGHGFVIPFLGDFNGDSKMDAGIFSTNTRVIKFYEGDGHGIYTLNTEQNPFDGITVNVPFASAGDLDGDGDSDFLIGDTGGVVRSFQNNVGEAVILSSGQIVAGLGTGNVTTNDTTSLALSGKGAEGLAQIAIYVDGNLLASVQANSDGEWTYTWLGTEDGCEIVSGNYYNLTVRQTDLAGNVSAESDSYRINVDMAD